MNDMKKLYEEMLPSGGFVLDRKCSNTDEGLYYYTLSADKGEGYFWFYFYGNMFVIEKQNFYFYDDFYLESSYPNFIAIQYFFSVSGEELHPYRQLSPNSLRAYVGEKNMPFQAIYHKKIPIHSISISIMPDFYHTYLKEKFGNEYIDPRNAFRDLSIGADFPELVALLKQISSYSGVGITAKLFYEGKVMEALALILDKAQKNQKDRQKISITATDEDNLNAVADYINHHFGFSIPQEQLCSIAYMGNTKLKTKFKEYFGCSITDYIIRKRINQAQHLLISTELSITEISQVVGYNRSDSFSKQFQRTTGLLPREYRKMIK